MMKNRIGAPVLLLSLALLALALPAAAMTINDLRAGPTCLGPNLTTKDMQGKVVMVEFWGTH